MFKWVVVFAIFGFGCTFHAIKHNQHLASKEADKILQVFLVERNLDRSLSLLSLGDDEAATIDDLSELLNKLHPAGDFPTSVTSVEYEPMPGQPAIRIFATGTGQDKEYYYMVVMRGTEPTGYRPSEIYRNDQPFPESSMRQPLR